MTTSISSRHSRNHLETAAREAMDAEGERPVAVPMRTAARDIAGIPAESHCSGSEHVAVANESEALVETEGVCGRAGNTTQASTSSHDTRGGAASAYTPLNTHRGPRPARIEAASGVKKTVVGMVGTVVKPDKEDIGGLSATLSAALAEFVDEIEALDNEETDDDTQDTTESTYADATGDDAATVEQQESSSFETSSDDFAAREPEDETQSDSDTDLLTSPDVSLVITDTLDDTTDTLKSHKLRQHSSSPDSVLGNAQKLHEFFDASSSDEEDSVLERSLSEGSGVGTTPQLCPSLRKAVSFSEYSEWSVHDIGSVADLQKEKNVKHETNRVVSWFQSQGSVFLKQFGFGSRSTAKSILYEKTVKKSLRESRRNMYENVDYNVAYSEAVDGMQRVKERELRAKEQREKRRKHQFSGKQRW